MKKLPVPIAGVVKTSLVDYPRHVCATVFMPGCNLRCPFCHNPDLVELQDDDRIESEEFFAFLRKRRGVLDGVCISGGEPTLVRELPLFAAAIKELGLKVKIDTNGTRPQQLQRLLQAKVVDYLAMDVKAPLERYPDAVGVSVPGAAVQACIELIKSSGIEYEFRTTVVPGLLAEEDLLEIGRWLDGAECYALQQFRPERTLDPALADARPYPDSWLHSWAERLQPFFGRVLVRGVNS